MVSADFRDTFRTPIIKEKQRPEDCSQNSTKLNGTPVNVFLSGPSYLTTDTFPDGVTQVQTCYLHNKDRGFLLSFF